MITYNPLDVNLINRLNNAKDSVKQKLFPLSISELILLPLRKNKPFPIFEHDGSVNEERLNIMYDVLRAKISDLIFYRDLAFEHIVEKGLRIDIKESKKNCKNSITNKNNKKIKHEGPFSNEYYFNKALLDRSNFPESIDKYMKQGAKIEFLDKQKHPNEFKKKTEAYFKRIGIYDPVEKISYLRNLFNENNVRNGDRTLVNRLKNIHIKTEFNVFPSNKWLYGIRRIKSKESIVRNIEKEIIEGIKNNPKEWNLAQNLANISLNDFGGMWFISKENVILKPYSEFKKSKISELKKFIYKESRFEIREGEYENKYKNPKSKAKSLRLYIRPKEEFLENTPFRGLAYSSYIKGFNNNHLVATVHLQDVYNAFTNKFYGKASHYTYQSKKMIKNEDNLSKLSHTTRKKILDYEYKVGLLLEVLQDYF